MESFRQETIVLLKNIIHKKNNQVDIKKLENSVHNETLLRLGKISKDQNNTEQDLLYKLSDNEYILYKIIYKQLYIKIISNKEFTDVYNIISSSREDLYADKWSIIKNTRSEDLKKIKKKGIHRCECGSWYTEHVESQRAAADESMSVAISCLDCGRHDKAN